jgi:hypothetical protein
MNLWETKKHDKGIFEDGNSQADSNISISSKYDAGIMCVGKCIECKINKKITQENQDLVFEDIEDMEYEETHFEYNKNNVSESSNYIR